MKYISTKTYGHNAGFTACFRQHRAESHCKFLHGYALSFKFTFGADELDERGWVVDFGSLKSLKGWLEDYFDHKTLVATDDPMLEDMRMLHEKRLIQLREVPATGCEAFAYWVAEYVDGWLVDNGYAPRVKLLSVEVREHEANSAIYNWQG